jgi:ornithine carbamoyltransferase
MKSIVSFADISKEEFSQLLDRAEILKKKMKSGEKLHLLDNKIVGLLFEKPSTRTRTSFEAAALKLGGSAIYMTSDELQLSRGEPVKDTARILGKYIDAIVARVFANETVVELAKYSGIPTINGLSDLEHPTQVVCDFLTIKEVKKKLKGITITYIGDGDNMANSLLLSSATAGANITIACPIGYEPNPDILAKAKQIAKKTGSKIKITNNPKSAVVGADVLYTDVWVSMGEEKERKKRLQIFKDYQINKELLKLAKKDAVVMHCLPAHRGLEITDDVIEGKQSIVWQQGENKLYGAAAILDFTINGNKK